MAHLKDKHYWTQLRATLAAGSWNAPFPARAPNGSPLSWSELLRKFNKHCVGFSDVAELASQTQALSLLLGANARDQSLDGNETWQENLLSPSKECLLSEERLEEGTTGYTVLQSLPSSKAEPVKLSLAYYAYALDRPSECLSLLEDVKELTDVQARIAAYGTMRSDSTTTQLPARSADVSSSSSWTESLTSTTTTAPETGQQESRVWGATECVRSICLRGMCYERLSPPKQQEALSAYLEAIPLMDTIVTDLQGSLANTSSYNVAEVRSPAASFARYRELWRWAERLLRRAIVLASRVCDVSIHDERNAIIWTLLDIYRKSSVHWPATFRPEQRSTVATIHVRAFVLRAQILSREAMKTKAPRWISVARSVLQELCALLSVCTRFPRAGERNVQVEDFVDLCVAVWEADGAVGEHAGWVIDFLWWATRLTFNSFRIYRHMTRLFLVSGDPALAKRTLRLYIQVVSKAQEAAASESPTASGASGGLEAGVEMDSDRQWVQTLVQGSRMLCQLAVQEEDYGKAVELAKEAGTVIQKAKTRLDADDIMLVSSIQLTEGVWHSVVAYTEQDPRTRSTQLSESLTSLQAAVDTFPSASACHHLALALSRPGPSRDIQGAIGQARAAVEAESGETRHWHLLGLLLAAAGDWKAAKGVLEIGIAMAEADLVEEEPDTHSPPDTSRAANGMNIRDFAVIPQTEATGDDVQDVNGHAEGSNGQGICTIPPDAQDIPPSSSLLKPVPDQPPPSRQENFEYALQMRMTQLALTEFIEGTEGVGEKWLEVFHWFREKRPSTMDDRRQSIDSRRISQDTRPSEVASIRTTQQPMTSMQTQGINSSIDGHSADVMLTAIPIKVTPATPGVSTSEFGLDSPTTIRQHDGINGEKRSSSFDEKDRDISRGKKVREVLKNRVHKGQVRITTISKKIGHGVGRHGSLSLKRTTSAPDFHSVLSQTPYQASSIHLRQYHSIHASQQDLALLEVPPPPPASTPDATARRPANHRIRKDRRLLSDLWLMSAAIFRRLGKVEQAKAAIQEAEVKDEDNPAVWVQLGLYYVALSDYQRAVEAFQKALFIRPNDVAATVYLSRIYLSASEASTNTKDAKVQPENVDLAAGLLSDLTRGAGWDVPEAWYFLARAYKLQGRRDRERECLCFALTLSETRGVRDIATAVGWCL